MTSVENIKMYLHDPIKLLVRVGRDSFLKVMDDETYSKMIFKNKLGYSLNLQRPQTFNEKIQWLNLHNRRPEFTLMVDKYAAKRYAEKVVGSEHIIPTIGVWKDFDEIDFSSLPEQFVLKCTHDSGGLCICKRKETFDIEAARKKINSALKTNYYWRSREWTYKNVQPRIIAEAYMENTAGQGLVDYKFFCFGGKAKMLYISQGLENHKTASISFCDMQGKVMPFHRSDYKPLERIVLPKNFDDMTTLAERMAQQIASPFIRIDLYSIDEKIYFSEITFCPCGGMMPLEPKEWDGKLGDWIELTGI